MSVLGPGEIIKNGSPCQVQGGAQHTKPSPSALTTQEVGFGARGFEVSLVAPCGQVRQGPHCDSVRQLGPLGPCRASVLVGRHKVRVAEAEGGSRAECRRDWSLLGPWSEMWPPFPFGRMSLCRLRCLWLQQGSLRGRWEQRTRCKTFHPTFWLWLVAFSFWVFLLSVVGGWPLCRGLGEELEMPGLDTGRLLGPLGSVKVSTDGDGRRGEAASSRGCFQQGLLQGSELGPSCQSGSRSRSRQALGQPGAGSLAQHPSGWGCLWLSPGPGGST